MKNTIKNRKKRKQIMNDIKFTLGLSVVVLGIFGLMFGYYFIIGY